MREKTTYYDFQTTENPWIDTNPAFSATLDGTWLVQIGPTGGAFRGMDRLCAIVRDGEISGGGKFYRLSGHVALMNEWNVAGNLIVTRTAQPWYYNAWTDGDPEFEITARFDLTNRNQAGVGEFARGDRLLAAHWHKLLV